MKPVRISVSSLAIAGFIAFGLSAAPIGVGDNFAPEIKSAFAKGKGSGKSSGKGGKGGKSSSKGGNSGDSDIESADGEHDDEDGDGKVGNGHIKAKGNGHAKNHDDGVEGNNHDDDGAPNAHGKLASLLGNLNAAHASPTALENANRENSIVGLLAAYAEAVEGDPEADVPVLGLTPEEQREALGEISNKSDEDGRVDDEVVAEVNRLLDPDEEDDAGTDDEDDEDGDS
ncbi:MAG: hypothetical protein GKS02_00480 [Alphaproteobacteria bacterium]|nr:hypothetical protein [Alphaproteobacteria bacterium]